MAYSRQLAAIMFTDIVNYTALMGDDENKAFDILQKNRQLQQPLIENHNGRLINEMGDGVLAIFFTVTDAVLCATKIQEDHKSADDFQIRIAIHLGEVILENNDVFGDGVNIASRLQTLAPIGGIYISESVYKNISNKKEIRTRFIRNEFLKHVKEPVSVYEIIVSDSISESLSIEVKRDFGKSIAVLPFVNMSNDPEQEYFSDGVAEEILNSLAHLKDLKVAGRTSSFRQKRKIYYCRNRKF
jgi:adenylate cyclase